MGKKNENINFICENCGKEVKRLDNGSVRNHCPFCLFSKHVDVFPGDRKCECHGLMEPIGVEYNSKKGYQLIHKCKKCGHIQKNIIAENCVDSDNKDLIYKIMQSKIYK